MQSLEFEYANVFGKLLAHFAAMETNNTHEITASIKALFCEMYGDRYEVLCSGGKRYEYMVDVLVTTFDPKGLIGKNGLAVSSSPFKVHLAVESELGGVSASGPYGVMRNAAEDFLKLLLIHAERRVMIMTSLPYSKETDHVRRRVEALRQLYAKFPGRDSGALIVHLCGSQPRSTQVQVDIGVDSVRGFLISPDGGSVREIHSADTSSHSQEVTDS